MIRWQLLIPHQTGQCMQGVYSAPTFTLQGHLTRTAIPRSTVQIEAFSIQAFITEPVVPIITYQDMLEIKRLNTRMT